MRRIACSLIAALLIALPAAAQKPDRSTPPQPGPPPSVKLPAIQKHALSNGLPVWLVEMHEVPVVQVTLVVLSGASTDPAGKFGIASLTAAMLDEGAGKRNALEIADAVDYLGASLGTGASYDASSVALWVPVARLNDALPIMADVALRPAFPAAELERLRKERLTSLLQARDDPRSVADVAFPLTVFGSTHRYGTSMMGTAAVLKGLSGEDLRGFYDAHYRPSNAALVVVGDVQPSTVLPLLETSFGGWKAQDTAVPATATPQAPQVASRQVYLIDKPGAPQSQVRIGWVGVARSTPDYFPLVVLNTILGGSFTSRLNQNLREEHGYTYGAGSNFAMRASAGPFVAAAGVQGDKTAESLREFFTEISGMLKPVPEDELARAKNYVALGFPGEFETTADLSGKLQEMIVYKLPENYFADYVQKIQAVTAADIQRVAQKYVLPDRAAVIVVGDRKTVEPAIKSLNLGPIKIMSIDDVMGALITP